MGDVGKNAVSAAAGAGCDGGNVVQLRRAPGFAKSHEAVFQDGAALVEEAARYLDGEGRAIARTLTGAAATAYATESMRLTTRLVGLARWLKLTRDVASGRLTLEDAKRRRARLTLDTRARASHNAQFEDLPDGLKDLVLRSLRLRDDVMRLDAVLYCEAHAARPVLSEALDTMGADITPAIESADRATASERPKLRLAFARDA